MDNAGPTFQSGAFRLTIAICGGALLGGSLVALLRLLATTFGYPASVEAMIQWAAIGAGCGAIQAATHIGLHLHREWLDAKFPHDHDDHDEH